jgi:hypothetical protein
MYLFRGHDTAARAPSPTNASGAVKTQPVAQTAKWAFHRQISTQHCEKE